MIRNAPLITRLPANACCICQNTLVKTWLYLSGFHKVNKMIVSKFVNSNCTRLRYFCPVFCASSPCWKRASVPLSSSTRDASMRACQCSVIILSIFCHKWAQFMSKQIVLAISMQIFDGFYKTSWSRPDTRLNDRLFARILKYVRHAIVWSLKFDMIDRIGRVNSCRESNSVCKKLSNLDDKVGIENKQNRGGAIL